MNQNLAVTEQEKTPINPWCIELEPVVPADTYLESVAGCAVRRISSRIRNGEVFECRGKGGQRACHLVL